MGISGLLPLLRSIHKHSTLKKFAGQTIGIDAYGWLHRGTVACAIELALDKPTTKYVDFAMGRVRMLLDFGVIPYLVFDGDSLPSKEGTNKERRQKRQESKELGLELYKAGKMSQAHQELQKAAGVTPYMAKLLIEELKKLDVQYVVAPYEADAQLVYLERKGIINGILSEDSDLLVYGAERLLTKLNQYGECVEIERADFAMCKEISLAGWTDAMFRRMAILSGCDYLPNIDKMGLKTAYRYVRKYREAERSIRMIQFDGKLSVPADYLVRFQHAELTFLHHRVFSPTEQKMVFLSVLEQGMKEEDMPYLGAFVEREVAIGVACGDLDPKTKEPFILKNLPRTLLKENKRHTTTTPTLKQKNSLDSFFTAHRQPLAELDPNSLTPSPSQQRLLQRNRNASWEPRTVSSAPQLRKTVTSSASTRPLSTNRAAFLARASTISTYQPPKRQRLCSEFQDSSSSKEVKQSPFFASNVNQPSPLVQKARNKRAKKAEFDVWSDDSVDDILLGLPDIQQIASPVKDHAAENDSETPYASAESHLEESVPQSSPCEGSGSPPPLLQDYSFADPSARTTQEDELEPFEDLIESHLRTRRESLMKSFAYQSESTRMAALKSISPHKQVSGYSQTFVAQSPEKQLAALSTLRPLGNIDDSCNEAAGESNTVTSISAQRAPETKKSQTAAEKIALARAAIEGRNAVTRIQSITHVSTVHKSYNVGARRALNTSSSSSSTPQFAGSEDALVPNSEDEGSEIEEDEKPRFNLKAFAFVPA